MLPRAQVGKSKDSKGRQRITVIACAYHDRRHRLRERDAFSDQQPDRSAITARESGARQQQQEGTASSSRRVEKGNMPTAVVDCRRQQRSRRGRQDLDDAMASVFVQHPVPCQAPGFFGARRRRAPSSQHHQRKKIEKRWFTTPYMYHVPCTLYRKLRARAQKIR